MHKSIIFLLGLLVFLIPIGPSSIMSNSNVMAFEDYGYEEAGYEEAGYEEADQYENYAMDMANDNYYKSQGNDFIKKIKCNNINSNFNGIESSIGLDNALGGIGAESIQEDPSASWIENGERVSGNFDVDCINYNDNENIGGNGGTGIVGPQGPQGPEGPQGPAGEQGPVGPNQILPTNLYTALGNRVLLIADDSLFLGISDATCDTGDVVLSGSYSVVAGHQNIDTVSEGALPTHTGWSTLIRIFEGFVQFETVAQCFDNPPLRS